MQDVHYSVYTATISLPHASETWLSSNIPELHGDIAFGDFAHIESNSWNRILYELARLYKQERK